MGRENSEYPEATRGSIAHSNQYSVRKVTARDVRYISIGRKTGRTGHMLPMKRRKKREKLNGWTYVGSYGFSHIYAKGDKRCLIDPKTGQSTFEYKVTMSSKRYGVRNIKDAYLSQEKKKSKIPDCELLSTCSFFNDMQDTSETTGVLKEQYCKVNYAWCGRYMVFKALERQSSFRFVA